MSGAGADLYRRLSRVAARWPVDVARRNRDLGEHVRERVQRDFRNAVTDGAQAKRLVRLGEAELAAMERLCDNHFKKMVRTVLSSCAHWPCLGCSTRHLWQQQFEIRAGDLLLSRKDCRHSGRVGPTVV